MTERCAIAIYVRYSDDQQRATSIDDQVRRCKNLARQNGFPLDNIKIYEDAAITGRVEGEAKREGFKRLLEAWDRNEFDVLLVDEYSRLSRDALTQAQVVRRLESSQRVRMITASGVDTTRPNWQLLVSFEGIVSQQEIRDTRHRVVRGMVGQLERGYMIAAPAFGYSLKREADSRGNPVGSQWVINEGEAGIVREIFERRARGESMHEIARSLNDRGVPTRRPARKVDGGYWRPSSIRNVLANTIYSGVFVWNGSTTARARAAKVGAVLEPIAYPRPQLRIVSDEMWQRCNQKSISRSGYGGGRHALAGLVNCGCCGSVLAVTSKTRCRSLYCPRCTIARSAVGATDRLTGTVATEGVQHLLIHAARHFVSESFIEAFKGMLRSKLSGDIDDELRVAKTELVRLEGMQDRLSRLLVADENEDPVLLARYAEVRERVRTQRTQVDTMAEALSSVDREAIEAQLAVSNPLDVLDGLFDADLPAAEIRAVLARLFPDIVLEQKPSRYQSVFSVRFAPGIALSIVSGTPTVDDEEVEMRFVLRYWPVRKTGEPMWTVEALAKETSCSSQSPIAAAV